MFSSGRWERLFCAISLKIIIIIAKILSAYCIPSTVESPSCAFTAETSKQPCEVGPIIISTLRWSLRPSEGKVTSPRSHSKVTDTGRLWGLCSQLRCLSIFGLFSDRSSMSMCLFLNDFVLKRGLIFKLSYLGPPMQKHIGGNTVQGQQSPKGNMKTMVFLCVILSFPHSLK